MKMLLVTGCITAEQQQVHHPPFKQIKIIIGS